MSGGEKKKESKGKTLCEACSKKCFGNVLRVQEKYFHIDCFKCSACSASLAQGGFFYKDGNYYCTTDYQKLYGTKCAGCGQFVEGEVVTALGNTYHQKCFVCGRCRLPFPPGEKVTYTGRECVCSRCLDIPVVTSRSTDNLNESGPRCFGCSQEIQEGQALIALDKQWHVWCFKCASCKTILHGEYMGNEGVPYCEKDYQAKFGVKCVHCERYITGKVLQAGENHHFHPTCARCTKCGDPFGDGEEMYMQGGAIWHPRCGPGPDAKIEDIFNNGYDGQFYAHHSPSLSRSRSVSPFGSLNHQYGRRTPDPLSREPILSDLSRVYTNSYLTAEPTQGYLKRPLEPRPPKSPQFHRPPDGVFIRRKAAGKPSPKQGMQALVDNLQSHTPRPRSPHMNNEEPIELAHYPSARKPNPNELPRIERDDFPAPPFPYVDPERRRRWSGNSRDAVDDDFEVSGKETVEDEKLKREEEELSKIASGIGKVFLKTLKEREKLMAWKKEHLDPRNASRTPSAKVEPPTRLRYDNPVNASPSRDIDRPKPWEEDEFDRGSLYRSSGGKLQYYAPPLLNYNVVSSLRNVPKPGYGLKSGLSPHQDGHLNGSESSYSRLEKTQSVDFNCAKSDISSYSKQPDRSRHYMNHSISSNFRATPFSDGLGGYRYAYYSPHFRRSMPNVNFHLHSNEPPKLYPYHLLMTSNYRLPPDVDRCHLERHLSNDEFAAIFRMSRLEFYRLPEWKRNDLKRRFKLY